MSSHLSVLISLSILIRGMYFQFGVVERAIVEIICVWSILLFITCWVKFAQGLTNEIQFVQRRHWNANFKSFSDRKELWRLKYSILQFILNNSWSVYCCLKIQDSCLRIEIKRRIFKDKIPNMTGWIWSTSMSQVLHIVILTCYIMHRKVERSLYQCVLSCGSLCSTLNVITETRNFSEIQRRKYYSQSRVRTSSNKSKNIYARQSYWSYRKRNDGVKYNRFS